MVDVKTGNRKTNIMEYMHTFLSRKNRVITITIFFGEAVMGKKKRKGAVEVAALLAWDTVGAVSDGYR